MGGSYTVPLVVSGPKLGDLLFGSSRGSGLQTTSSARAEPHMGGAPDARGSHPMAAYRPNVWVGSQRMVLLQNRRLNGVAVPRVFVHAGIAFCR